MIKRINLRIKPEEFADRTLFKSLLEKNVGREINDFRIVRKSIDSRQRNIWVDTTVDIAYGDDSKIPEEANSRILLNKVDDKSQPVVIVGAGPAGLFAALRCLELGMRPIVIERGKAVDERLRDVVELQKSGRVNPESNFCFGEGGAGTFSDGKLYTRSKKRGNVKEILQIFNQFGASPNILFESHPHIGSEKLPAIIKAMREAIIENGGEVKFNTRFQSLIIESGDVKGIVTDTGERILGPVILATGHSARDVYETLQNQGVRLEAKGFAMGVRLEHPQQVIDSIMYHNKAGRGEYLPPAEYSLACQVDGRGVYSFCMCPGGVIVPAMSDTGESVVNGMSVSSRSGKWANSGMVVEIRPEDYPEYIDSFGALGLMRFQKDTEKRFYQESNSINAPAQRMKDFTEGKRSATLPNTSYVPGIHSADFSKLLPEGLATRLKEGLKIFGRRHKGFLTNDAILLGLESRTSSPVRIPRDKDTLSHPDLPGLYPVGEGAGYAGGIVSSAMDGRNAVDKIYQKL